MKPLCLLGISTVLFVLAGCARIDYAYRHEVAVRVVHAVTGRPLAGVTVERLEAGMTNTPARALYLRTTAADGSFRFLYSGLGPRPLPAHEWVLFLHKAGYRPASVTNRVSWLPFAEGRAAFGYVLTNLQLRLAPAGE